MVMTFPALVRRLLVLAVVLTFPPAPALAGEAEDVASVHAFIEDVARRFNTGDLEAFIGVFTPDAQIISQGFPDIVGRPAIHDVYAAAMAQYGMSVAFNTTEVAVAGDMAYERGTYRVDYKDKESGDVLMSVAARHIHILKRDPEGRWRTWRMMTNTEAPAQ